MSAPISIGTDTFIGYGCQINVGSHFRIGNECLIAPGCIFSDAHHHFSKQDISISKQGGSYHPIVVADNVWIGAGTIILKGVNIGEGSVIAAGSVVTTEIPSRQLWAGVPAQVKKKLN
jgi:acetyltransferase-like isoleucine patch superfamily enzyme